MKARSSHLQSKLFSYQVINCYAEYVGKERKLHHHHHTNHRAGYEFSRETRLEAFERAEGQCQAIQPDGYRCSYPHDKTVDHIISIHIGRIKGIPREYLKSLDNAQCLCHYHQRLKTEYERNENDRLAREVYANMKHRKHLLTATYGL